jgi:hypothetical protein
VVLALVIVAAVVALFFAVRFACRVAAILADQGRSYDAWGHRLAHEYPRTFVRILHAPGIVPPIYCLLLGRDWLGQKVCGWWDQERERVLFIRPRGGRWLKRREPPRPLTAADLDAMRQAAQRHADWEGPRSEQDTRVVGSLPE